MGDDSVVAHMFGSPRFARAGRPVVVPPACLALFAYMLLDRGAQVPRNRLLGLVGAEVAEGAARRRLNTTVWRLRCALEDDGAPRTSVVASTGSGLAIAEACRTWVDVTEFESACATTRPVTQWSEDDAELARRAVDLYVGPFLDGLYDEWVLEERARLADVYLSALVRLAHWHEDRDQPETALRYAHLAVTRDPLREDLQRLLIRLYRRAGLPELAVQQFEVCRAALHSQLGVEPRAETRAEAGLGTGPDDRLSTDALDRALGELTWVREQVGALSRTVERSIRELHAAREAHEDRHAGAREARAVPAPRR